MESPLISIIIPVYNGSNFLKDSIDSALSQTYKNIEVIVVNDGSNDGGATEKIALSYNNRIRYFSKANGGVSSALNFGIRQMKSEWFSWLSHDDLYYPDKVKEQVKMILNTYNNKCIIMSSSELINEKGDAINTYIRKLNKVTYNGHQMFNKLLISNPINGCSLLIPKEAIVKAGYFDESLKYIQDWKMWIMLALDDYSFLYFDKPLVRMRIHGNQQTIQIKDSLPKESQTFVLELIDKLKEDLPSSKGNVMSVMFWGVRSQNQIVMSKAINLLKITNNFNLKDKVKYYSYFPIGFTLGKLNKMIKWYLNDKRRRTL